MRQRILAAAIMFLVLSQTPSARADEIGELRDLIQKQNEQLQQLQENLDELEAKQKQQAEEKAAEAVEERPTGALPQWLERIRISGDLRYRHDNTNKEAVDAGVEEWLTGADRNRIRARLMIEAMLSKDLDVAIRFASGTTRTPNSTNQDLEDAFSSKNLWLDLAYFDWHPEAHKGLNVFGGKMKFPFYRVVKNELMMDNDVNPEGLAVNYVMDISDADQLFLSGGGFWVDEDSSGADTSLWGAQTYLKHKLSKPDYVLAGASFYDYGNIQGRTALSRTWSSANTFFGNTADTSSDPAGVYASDFDIFEAFGEYGFNYGTMPMALFGSWMQNVVASTNEDTGWLVGARFNKIKDPGSWEFTYDYRDIDADAVVGGFTESDFVASRTDSRGHRFVAKYQIAKPLQAAVTYYHAKDTSNPAGNLNFRRLMADLVFKF
ncbi:MAG: putative porin [Planctomycetota bacterium]|jgi:hypothetical protein